MSEQARFQEWWESKGVNSVILRAQAWSAWLARAEVDQPQPAEDPDEWVEITNPDHVIRKCDQLSDYGTQWYPPSDLTNAIGKTLAKSGFSKVRCRRRDLPKVEQAETTTMQVNPGEGYRWLEDHEIVQPDDEVFNPTATPCWVKPLTRAGNTVKAFSNDDYPVRRKVEQPEQWPKYYKPSQPRKTGYGKHVAYYKCSEAEKGETVHTDGTSFSFTVRAPGLDWTEITEAEAMLLLDKPAEPQPQKTRVRLWMRNEPKGRPSVFACDERPYPDSHKYIEIHHDAEGFYVEGGQS